MNATLDNSSLFANRVNGLGRKTPDNWHVHVTGRRPRPRDHWDRSPAQQALLATIGRPFA